MHNIDIVSIGFIYLENYSFIQKFHYVCLCFCVYESKDIYRKTAEQGTGYEVQ